MLLKPRLISNRLILSRIIGEYCCGCKIRTVCNKKGIMLVDECCRLEAPFAGVDKKFTYVVK